MFCRPVTLCILHSITETIGLTEGRKYFPGGPYVGQPCSKLRRLAVPTAARSRTTIYFGTLKDSCNSALYNLQLDTPVSTLSIRPPDLHQRRTKYRYRISGVHVVT